MPERSDVTYFGAGPALLPTPVLEAASVALLNYNDTGLGLAEHSHRSSLATQILEDTKADLQSLLSIPDDYEILFMQGGGSGEFSAVVYNLVNVWVERRRRKAETEITSSSTLKENIEQLVLERLQKEVREELKLDYILTGSWSLKASQEAARLIGPEYVNIVVDARDPSSGKFRHIPDEKQWKLTPTVKEGGKGSALVWYCDNETVDGVEFPSFPKCLEAPSADNEHDDERLIVADMSSNILSRHVDISKYAVIFAGAQKNIGTTGLTIVILRKSLLPPHTAAASAPLLRSLGLPIAPTIFDYATMAKNKSLYNTLSIFDVWVAGQVIKGLLTRFPDEKVRGMEKVADQKARLLYEVLEKHSTVYTIVPEKKARSRMNICFRIGGVDGDAEAEKTWLAGAEEQGLIGLKGHRSVGGIRCSNYNSISTEDVEKIVRYLDDYARR